MHMAGWNANSLYAPELMEVTPLALMVDSPFALYAKGDRNHTLRA